MYRQLDLFFDNTAKALPSRPIEPADAWREDRERRIEMLRRKLGVPLYEEVEVCLTQGVRLCGFLNLAETGLWVEGERDRVVLRIGKATFRLGEIESIVRQDGSR